jgi:hypothetical protein
MRQVKSKTEGRQAQQKTEPSQVATYIGATVFTAVYLLVVYWLKSLDVWNNSFDDAGGQYLIYNLLKIVFLLFFGWIMYYAGYAAIRLARRNKSAYELGPVDIFLASSFLGAAVYTMGMFMLGLLRLYYVATALTITAPVVFLSWSRLKEIAGGIPASFSAFRSSYFRQETKLNMLLAVVLILIATWQLLYLLASKGLMPDLLTNDTIGHYIPYYQEVLRTHGIWMNKYFLHFYYTKSAGLFFLSGLLADVQSMQLVSFYFFLLAGLTVYAFTKRATHDDLLWMLLAVVLYFSYSIFLEDGALSAVEFSKPHMLIGSFIAFIVYSTVIAPSLPSEELKSWHRLQRIFMITVILVSPVSAAFVLP